MVLAERLAAGYGDDDLFVIGWREELGLKGLADKNRTALAVVAAVVGGGRWWRVELPWQLR